MPYENAPLSVIDVSILMYIRGLRTQSNYITLTYLAKRSSMTPESSTVNLTYAARIEAHPHQEKQCNGGQVTTQSNHCALICKCT